MALCTPHDQYSAYVVKDSKHQALNHWLSALIITCEYILSIHLVYLLTLETFSHAKKLSTLVHQNDVRHV